MSSTSSPSPSDSKNQHIPSSIAETDFDDCPPDLIDCTVPIPTSPSSSSSVLLPFETMSTESLLSSHHKSYSSTDKPTISKHSHSHSHSHSSKRAHSHSHSPSSTAISIAGPSSSSSNGRSGPPSSSPIQSCGGLGKTKRKRHNSDGKEREDSDDDSICLRKEDDHYAASDESKANAAARRKLWIVSLICMVFMVAEIIGGFIANSLAIMTDAAHLLSDLAGFLISIFALWLATRAPTSRLSFGFHRAEIIGALLSVILIWVLTGILVYEAAYRIKYPEDVDGKVMFIVATTGLCVNILMGFILHQAGHSHSHGLGGGGHGGHGHSHGGEKKKKKKHNHSHSHSSSINSSSSASMLEPLASSAYGIDQHGVGEDEHDPMMACSNKDSAHDHAHAHGGNGEGDGDEEDNPADNPHSPANINVSAAFIHVVGDAIQSIGVMIAAAIIWYEPEYKIADPITTFIFSLLVLFTTTRLIKQSMSVLMEGVPEGIEPSAVDASLHQLEGVIEVHDLHIWSLSVGKPSLSVHILQSDEATGVLERATNMLAKKYNIHHTTIQIEKGHDMIACNE